MTMVEHIRAAVRVACFGDEAAELFGPCAEELRLELVGRR